MEYVDEETSLIENAKLYDMVYHLQQAILSMDDLVGQVKPLYTEDQESDNKCRILDITETLRNRR